MSDPEIPQIVRDIAYAEQHRLLNVPERIAAKRLIALGIQDDFVRGLIQDPVRDHKIREFCAGPFSIPHLLHGEILLGFDPEGGPIYIPIQYFNGNSLTIAGSGAGKTVKSRWLALQVAPRVKATWLFDLRKREFRVLRPWLAQAGIKLIILPGRMMRWNPLEVPEHVDAIHWAMRAADLLVQVLQLPPRATKLLHAAIINLYERFDVFAEGQDYPTLFDLRETIASDPRANPQARQAILDSLDPVLLSLRGVLSYRRGWSTRDLQRHIVFEFAGLSEVDKDLLLSSLLLAEFSSRLARGISNPDMDLWICADEAARLVSSSNPAGGLRDLIGLIRGTGIGLDLSLQSSEITPTVLSNTANKFIGRCTSFTDLEAIGSSMGLTGEQRRCLIHTLAPGLFAGQVAEGDWRYPFLFRIPKVDFSRAPEERVADQTAAPRLPGWLG